jgi:hypothetical protein
MRNRTIAAVALLTGIAVGAPTDARACSCMSPNLVASYQYASDTIAARVLTERQRGNRLQYRVEVIRAYSGCLQPGERITIETPVWSASCGQPLALGRRYLLTADASDFKDDPNVFSINLCGYNRALANLTADDLAFLESRSVFCEETGQVSCADGSDPVQCFADPCEVESCAEATMCEANYCGGCDAEFYSDDWTPVCEDQG